MNIKRYIIEIMKQNYLIFLFTFTLGAAFGQLNVEKASLVQQNIYQPTVMVIPFAKEGENMRAVLEDDYATHLRVAVSLVKKGLEQHDVQTKDFRAVLQQIDMQKDLTANQQHSLKQEVITLSAADIYIETEARIIRTPRGTSVTVLLNAYDAFTGQTLLSELGHSPKFYTDNFEKLTEKALTTFLDGFCTSLQEAFRQSMQNGRSIAIDIGISEGATIDMDSEIDNNGDLLSDLIENWLEENAYQSYFHIQGVTATKMIIDEVKIPAKDPVTKKNYSPSRFVNELRKYFVKLGLEVSRDIQGTKVFITISG